MIVGASRDQQKYGNRAVRAYLEVGTTVYPINPNDTQIEGTPSFKTIADVPPGRTTLASIYTQPDVTATLLPGLANYGIKDVYFNPGSERDDLVQQARALGLNPILACSITAIGKDPVDYVPS